MKANPMTHSDLVGPRWRPWAAGALTVAAMLTLTSGSAFGQPNPFDDYERGEPPPPFPGEVEEPAKPPAPGPAGDAAPVVYRSDQWQFGTGLGLQFAYTGTTNETLFEEDRTNRTMFARVTPEVRLFVIDNLEVGVSLGLLSKLSSREGGTQATENNFLFEFSGFYHVPVGAGFALVPGLGLGGYVGSSSRDLLLPDGTTTDESTATRGFNTTIHLTGAYQPHENWRLRTGLTFGLLVGAETVSSQDATLSTSAAHIGLPVELVYLF